MRLEPGREPGHHVRVVFQDLLLWLDPVRRSGPEVMAVDEWLLERVRRPVLRVYEWQGQWASVGYFGRLAEARASLPGVSWVRRWTGGGVVDHRSDWTYTVVAPREEPWACQRGAESYRSLHQAVAAVLAAEGLEASLSGGEAETGAALCFENPVHHDVTGAGGAKLAGAGQRRTRFGLLHQGSVAVPAEGGSSRVRGERLAGALAQAWSALELVPPAAELARRMEMRYAAPGWTERR